MNIKVSQLKNGLTIATDPMAGLETASVGVWVGAGARNESVEQNGISHLLEHMAFKGTSKRSARDIAEQIEAVGGHLNAYTTREQTAYFARVLEDNVPLAIDILSDILQFSTFDDIELSREQSVIVQEINEAYDSPDDVVFDQLQQVAFPDQPMGRNILGTAERVLSFKREHLINYMQDNYNASHMILAGAGAVDHKTLCDLAEDVFTSLPSANNNKSESAIYVGGELKEDRDLEQVHLVIGFPSFAYTEDDYFAAQVLSTALGGGMSSRLFQEVREKRGLAYSIFSFSQAYRDGGLFGVYAGTSPQNTDELVEVICNEIKNLSFGLRDDELVRSVAQHKSGILMSLESSSARCDQLARQLQIYGRPISPKELSQKIDSVDNIGISNVVERITSAPPSLSVIGPASKSSIYEKISHSVNL